MVVEGLAKIAAIEILTVSGIVTLITASRAPICGGRNSKRSKIGGRDKDFESVRLQFLLDDLVRQERLLQLRNGS